MERRALGGYVLVAVAALGWGTWPLILRWAARGGHTSAAAQSAIVMIVLTVGGGLMMLRDRMPERGTRREWLGIAWLGVGDTLNVIFFFAAYQTTNVAIAVLTHYLAPIFVALLAPLALRERGRPGTMLAVAISFLGLIALLRPWGAELSRRDLVGAGYGAASAVFYASNVLVNKRLTRSFSASELMFYHGLVAVPILLALARPSELAHTPAASIGPLMFGALLPGTLGGLCFTWGLRRIPATHASILTLLEPLSAVLIAAAVLSQPLGWHTALGGAMILAGAAIVMRPSRTPNGVATGLS